MTTAARALSAQAHGLRNQLNVLTMASSMVEDAELAAELRATAGALTRSVERLVIAARVELGEQPATAHVRVAELVELAARRVRREGRAGAKVAVRGAAKDVQVQLPGTWAERLVADVLHAAEPDAAGELVVEVAAAGKNAVIVTVGAAATEEPDELLEQLASALGARLESTPAGSITVRLPRV